MTTKALLCGRGRSLVHYKNILDNQYDYACLINEFNVFIREDKHLLNFLKSLSKETFLTQQVNISTSGVDDFLLDNISIDEITCTRLKPNGESFWWRDYVNTAALGCYGRDLTLQPEKISAHMHRIENSLGVAVLNLILEKNCTEIDIIGSDFYEDDYYLSHREYDWEQTSRKETQDRLKSGFDYIISEFKDVQFNLYTCSTYKNSSSNCFIERVV